MSLTGVPPEQHGHGRNRKNERRRSTEVEITWQHCDFKYANYMNPSAVMLGVFSISMRRSGNLSCGHQSAILVRKAGRREQEAGMAVVTRKSLISHRARIPNPFFSVQRMLVERRKF